MKLPGVTVDIVTSRSIPNWFLTVDIVILNI